MVRRELDACTWCRRAGLFLDADHVFSRSIGGTRQLAVLACRECQVSLSKAEQELARRSIFALYRIGGGPTVRNKKRTESGSIEVTYVLVKDRAIGGYSEVGLRVGQMPVTLPCIEVDVVRGTGFRTHGRRPQDIDELAETILQAVKGSPDKMGCVGEIAANFFEEDKTGIATDPDFWPRVFLDLRGRLTIRARNPEEGIKLATVLVPLVKRGIFSDHSRWVQGEIEAGTTHHVEVRYDEPSVFRVIAKIAYGVVTCKAPTLLADDPFACLRSYILGQKTIGIVPPVCEVADHGQFEAWPEYHIAAIEPYNGTLRGLIILYGSCHCVDFRTQLKALSRVRPIVAISRRDGTDTRLVNKEQAEQIVRNIRSFLSP